MMRYYVSPMNQHPHWAMPDLQRRMHWMGERPDMSFVTVDIVESNDRYILTALVPGLKAEDVNISVEKDVLSLESERGYEREEDKSYLVAERPSGGFKRSFRLPSAIDTDKIEAHLNDGILTVEIPKSDATQPRNIKVN
jgi:HSP20 family protein